MSYGHPTVTRVLLEHGADVNFKNSTNETPLHLVSAIDGNMEVAQLLLERGADPHLRCKFGRDSLYMALSKGCLGLAQLLLKHGADPNVCDVDGETLLYVSSRLGDWKRKGTNEVRRRHKLA